MATDKPPTENWRDRVHGEPALADLLNDPLTHLVMARDGVNRQTLCAVIAGAQRQMVIRPVSPCRFAA